MDRIENILDTGGRYLSGDDRKFVATLLNELEQFQYQAPKDRALMFHPLGGFQRYLIHKVTEVFPKLTSFSIGDDNNRRTVVCFKSKKKDQQQGLQAASGVRTLPTPKNDYGPAPQHGRPEGRRSSMSGARSRDSSRSRKKHVPSTDYVNMQAKPDKADSMSHLPKPLRNKKTSTRREQMKRSRSLQSSPVHNDEPAYFLTDQDEKRGRRKRENDAKRAPRASSLKPLNRRRDRTEPSDDEFKYKKKQQPMRHNASDVSLARRAQGLQLEGHVLNGDVEDPYAHGDPSDSERVDREAVRTYRNPGGHKKSAPRAKKPVHVSDDYESDTNSDDTQSSDDQLRGKCVNGHRHTPDEEEDDVSEVGARVRSSDEEEESTDGEESISCDSDARPPSYNSIKKVASMKKAERNLDRIKRVDSQRSSGKSDYEQASRDSSSSAGSSRRKYKTKSANSSPGKPINKNRSSTMPRSNAKEQEKVKPRSSSTKRAQTLKSNRQVPKEAVVPIAKQKVEVKKEAPQRSSTGIKKSKSRKIKPDQVVPSPARKSGSADLAVSTDDLLQGSNSTLYMNLPDKKPKSGPPKEKKGTPSGGQSPAKSTASKKSNRSKRCDGMAQTEISGTLSRRKEPSTTQVDGPAPTQSQAETSSSWSNKNPADAFASMLQYFGVNPTQGIPAQAPMPNINPNAFQQFLQQQSAAQNPVPSFPPLPPHLAHQLYLSWLGAYYAGAAGTWPPPAPPAFLLPQMAAGATSAQQTPFELPNFGSPSSFSPYARQHVPDGQRSQQDGRDEDSHYYEQFYPPETYPDPPPAQEPKYPFASYPAPDNSSSLCVSGSVEGDPKHQNLDERDYNYSSHSAPYLQRLKTKAENPEYAQNGHGSSSFIHSDAETDASSVASSTARSEVAVATESKGGGLVVYVRGSRTNSTATHESNESLSMSDNIQSLSSTSRTHSDHSSLSNQSDRKKSSPRQQKPKQPGKSRSSAPASKSARGPRKTVPGEEVTLEASNYTNSPAAPFTNSNNNHSLPATAAEVEHPVEPHAAVDSVMQERKPPKNRNLTKHKTSATHHSTPVSSAALGPVNNRLESDHPSLDASAILKEGVADASHEEMILSLRRAPLATIEDDIDGSMSASHASSCSSLHSASLPPSLDPSEQPKRSSDPPSIRSSMEKIQMPVVAQEDSNADEVTPTPSPPAEEAVNHPPEIEDRRSSSSSSSQSSSEEEEETREAENDEERKSGSEWPAPPSYESLEKADSIASLPVVKVEDPEHESQPADEKGNPRDSDTNTSTRSEASSGGASPVNQAPKALEEQPRSESSTSSDSNSDEEKDPSPEANQPETEQEARLSTPSPTSDDRHDTSASESSYDADQSRLEESTLAKPAGHDSDDVNAKLVTELDGDVVVQDPELDYNSWKPNKDKYKQAKYQRYVEAHGFPADMSDVDITKHLSNYRGLRFSRVDKTHALCILPTPEMADDLLDDHFEAFGCRSLDEASQATQKKADRKIENEEFEEARASRPHTNTSAARRMIAGALGSSKFAPPSSSSQAKEHRRSRKSGSKIN